MGVVMHLKRPSTLQLFLAYLVFIGLVCLAIVQWQAPLWISLGLIVPLLFGALKFSRRTYLPLLLLITAITLWLNQILPTAQRIPAASVLVSSLITLLATEIIHNQTLAWQATQNALKQSEQKYASIFEIGPDAMIVSRVEDGCLLAVNQAFTRLSGYSVEEVIGKTSTELGSWLSPYDRTTLIMMLRQNGEVQDMETTLIVKNGRPVTGLISARLINWNGQSCILMTLRDISERKRIEEALRASEQKTQAMLSAIPDRIFVLDGRGNYLSVHTPSTPALDIIGKNLRDILPAEVASNGLAAIRTALKTGQLQVFEYSLEEKNDLRFYEARIVPNGTRQVLTIVRDVTDQKQAELRLQQTEQRYRSLVEQLSAVIYIDNRDADSTCLYVSQQVEKVFGYTPKEWLSTPHCWLNSIHPDDRQRVEALHTACNQSGADFWAEYRVLTKTGQVIWVEDRALLTPNQDGEMTFWQGLITDITPRKRAEAIQSALYRIAQAVISAPTPQALYASIHQTLNELLPANNFYIALFDAETNRFSYPYWSHERRSSPTDDTEDQQDDELARLVLRLGDALLIDAARLAELTKSGEISPYQVDPGLHTWLGCPLQIEGHSIGVLAIQTYQPNVNLGEEEKEILRFVSGQIAMAIDRKRAEANLRESEERYALATEGANDGIWDWNLRSNVIYFSKRWHEILGFENGTLSTSPDAWFSRIHLQDLERVMAELSMHLRGETPHFESEYRMAANDGHFCWVLTRGLAVRDARGQVYRVAGSMSDISARKADLERLAHDAMHDPLSNLPNRAYFVDQVQHALERARRRSDYRAAVLFLDMDRFKIVNESLGHPIGDQLIVAVAQRLKASLRPGDTLARIGGDEFAILVEDLNNLSQASQIAHQVQQKLSTPFEFQGYEIYTSVTIGIVQIEPHYSTPQELMRDADAATYRAKANGRGGIEIFDAKMHAASIQLLKLESELRRAIERHELRVYFQPIFSLKQRKVTGFEALLRWQHPTRGTLLPAQFINLAEETGLILPIGSWVLHTACTQAHQWIKAGYPDIQVAVNISASQFRNRDVISLVQQALSQTGLPGQNLKIEITENIAMQDVEATTRALDDLTAMQVEVLIDDFGTGYSSLNYLKRFPVSGLKIDQTFIRGIPNNSDDISITSAILAMTKALKLEVIAEGVENREQVRFLVERSCDQIQGFWISPAVPGVATLRLLQNGVDEQIEKLKHILNE
jgi:diguanylate cyclase (GGDEF)-like protein/PAS domain S-box-containing protein